MILQLYPLTCSITFIHGHHGHHISVTVTHSITFDHNKEQIHKNLSLNLKLRYKKNSRMIYLRFKHMHASTVMHQISDISEAQTDHAPR